MECSTANPQSQVCRWSPTADSSGRCLQSEDVRLRRGFLFVILERRDQHLRFSRVRTVDGLAALAEGLHSETLRVTRGLGSFRPGVAVRMERNSGDADGSEPLDEHLGTVAFMNPRECR